MLELYHNINSVCAQKVRIALEEKGQQAEEHVLTLRGDQNEPAYLKLNPSGVVPTLVHDGAPVVERKLLAWMADSLASGPYLAGDSFSNAECAVIPYILRLELLKLDRLWADYPAIADWWARMRARPSVKAAIFDRMTEKDWAPFKNLAPDPWPKVQELLRATA